MEATVFQLQPKDPPSIQRTIELPFFFKVNNGRENANVIFEDEKDLKIITVEFVDSIKCGAMTGPLPFKELPANVDPITEDQFTAEYQKVTDTIAASLVNSFKS